MIHILRHNETLEMLSVRYGLPVCMIMRANPKTQLSAGSRIVIPDPNICAEKLSHTVRAGDTLYSIAAEHNTTMYALLQYNNILHPGDLHEGLSLTLPPPAHIYTCNATDTISTVCKQFGITEDALRSCNQISDALYNGLQLCIPQK